ncbi:MAG: helix-turn-helix domain-containing protein [Planctomycetota bacterium]|jgi:DNA-binding transcriptional regulator YiaG
MAETAVQEEVEAIESTDRDVEELGREQKKSQFVQLRAKGLSYAKIAKELKVSTSTLTNWNQELQEEIAQAKAMELEALQEEYFILKEGRIRLLGDQLKAIQEEIGGRDLSKISTERLMDLQLRYFGELKTEYVATSAGDRIGIKLNSKDIAEQLQSVLERYKAGQIDEAQAKQEQTILQSMLKAIEQTELVARLEKIESVVNARR